jgi:hypothetical protein
MQTYHGCLGYTTTIPQVLHKGWYDSAEQERLMNLTRDFNHFKTNPIEMREYGGIPTKYLK